MELSQHLQQIARKMNVEFTLKGAKILPDQIFSTAGLLPGLVKRADQLASLCFGYGLGMKIEEDEQALLGVTVTFDDYTPDVLRLLCIVDSLQELINMSPSASEISLDELMYD